MKSNPKVIKLTGNSFAVLALLEEFGDLTSYEIKGAMEKSIENFWPVPHTTAYEEPARLAAAGYLSARQEEGGRRRRIYSVTEKGREALREWSAAPTASPPQLRDEAVLKVFAGADPEPIRAEREAWHRMKLAELQGMLDEVRQAEGFENSEPTLQAGVAYHRMWLDVLERLGGQK
ncbi:MAG TPA: PadR family transcriptional regulator [Solirubrobacterales bacterium]|nr:PadR family transcriptional regulator [Solirubrobacterales bacterium]